MTSTPPVSDWTHDALWQKAKAYAARAFEEERESELFAFWLTLALEFLGRATLAQVHPVLLADPQQPENIMHAVGFTSKKPRSIAAHTVFSRCATVAKNFTQKDADACMGLIERRNEELHSGTPAFSQFPTRLWLSEYYRVSDLLLQAQGKTLEDLFGSAEATAAAEMIKVAEEKTVSAAKAAIGIARRDFGNLEQHQQDQRRTHGDTQANSAAGEMDKIVECPACGSKAVLSGQWISTSDPRLEDEQVVQEHVVLPTQLECHTCALKLVGHGAVHAAGYGGQYTVHDYSDPVLFYGDFEEGPEYDNE